MKVLFDARWILIENRFDGVSRYSHELAHALANIEGLEVAWLVYDQRQADKLPAGQLVWANNPNHAFKEFFTLAKTINKSGFEIVYSPFFTIGTLGKKFKLILTIHDMIYFTFKTPPQWLPWTTRIGWRLFHLTYWPLRWQLNKANHVATVSNTAKKELIEKKATKRQITTVSNAVNGNFSASVSSQEFGGKRNKVVYMGAFTPYKNVECVIDAVSLVPEVELHLCGKLPATRRSDIENRLKQKGIINRTIIYDGSTDDEYKAALKDARCSISASRLEGFGLPIIEAQVSGIPFIASDTEIFREVAGQSALFFNPEKPEEAAERIKQLDDEITYLNYQKLGYENASNYTWENSALVAYEIINRVTKD